MNVLGAALVAWTRKLAALIGAPVLDLLIAMLAFGSAASMAPPPPSHDPGPDYLGRFPVLSIVLFAACAWLLLRAGNRRAMAAAIAGFGLGCYVFSRTLVLTASLVAG